MAEIRVRRDQTMWFGRRSGLLLIGIAVWVVVASSAQAVPQAGKAWNSSTLNIPGVSRSQPHDVSASARPGVSVEEIFLGRSGAPDRPEPAMADTGGGTTNTDPPAAGTEEMSLFPSSHGRLGSQAFLDRWQVAPPYIRQTDRLFSAISSYNRLDRIINNSFSFTSDWANIKGRKLSVALGLNDNYQADHVYQILSRVADNYAGPVMIDANGNPQGTLGSDSLPDYINTDQVNKYEGNDELYWYEIMRRQYNSRWQGWTPSLKITWGDPELYGSGWTLKYDGSYQRNGVISSVYGDISANSYSVVNDASKFSLLWRGPLLKTGLALEAEARFNLKVQSSYPLDPVAGNQPLWFHPNTVPYAWFDPYQTPDVWSQNGYTGWFQPNPNAPFRPFYTTNPDPLVTGVKFDPLHTWLYPQLNPFWDGGSSASKYGPCPYGASFYLDPATGQKTVGHCAFAQGPFGYTDFPTMPVDGYRQGGVGRTPDARETDLGFRLTAEQDANLVGTHKVEYTLDVSEIRVHYRNRETSDPTNAPYLYSFFPGNVGGPKNYYGPVSDHSQYLVIGDGISGGQNQLEYTGSWQPVNDINFQPDINGKVNQSFLVQGNPMLAADPFNAPQFLNPGVDTSSWSLTPKLDVGDRWQPSAIPGFTSALGIAWLPQLLYAPDGSTGLTIWDNLAPRVAAYYSPSGMSGSMFYGFARRNYDPLPIQLYTRLFSQETIITRTVQSNGQWILQPNVINGTWDPWVVQGGNVIVARKDTSVALSQNLGQAYTNPGTGAFDVKGQHSDEFELGMSQSFVGGVTASARINRSILREIIEDMSLDDGYTYVVGNPGRGSTTSAVQYDVLTTRALLNPDGTLATYQYSRPSRNHTEMELALTRELRDHWSATLDYKYTRSIGNIPVGFDNSIDQSFSAIYDLPELTVNRYGPLPDDITHTLFLSGEYQVPLSRFGLLDLQLNHTYHSGAPIDVRGPHPDAQYSDGEVYILPRGAGGRLPDYRRTDLGASWEIPLGGKRKIRVGIKIWNLFGENSVTAVEERYTTLGQTLYVVGGHGGVLPIEGGTLADLPDPHQPDQPSKLQTYDKDVFGNHLLLLGSAVSPYFKRPTQYQTPRTVEADLSIEF